MKSGELQMFIIKSLFINTNKSMLIGNICVSYTQAVGKINLSASSLFPNQYP